MSTPDFFRARLAHLIDPRHPLAVLAQRMPWPQLEAAMAPLLKRSTTSAEGVPVVDLFGAVPVMAGAPSPAGRPRLPARLMLSLLYLKHAFNLSDEALVERWSENVYWPFFSGMEHFEPRLPCDATQVGRFRTAIGEAGVEEWLKATIDCAVASEALKPDEFKVVRDVRRKLGAVVSPLTLERLGDLLARAERIRSQKPKDKNKLYALHAPEVECIGKGKARQPYEFGVKASFAITHARGLIVGASTFPGNPYDGHVLSAPLEQTGILLQDVGVRPTQAVVDLGYRGVDADNPGVDILHRGRWKSMSQRQRRWLKRRQAIEPVIGHLKADHGMARCWLRGAAGDALHAVLCTTGFNFRWLLRAIACGAIRAIFLRLLAWPKGVGLGASAPWRGWIEALGDMIVLRGRSFGLGQA